MNAAQVASDLRFIIDKRLAEAGIVIAFPQRERAIRCRSADQGGDGRGRGPRSRRSATAQARAMSATAHS